MALIVSTSVRGKLSTKTPPVNEEEIIQAFANRIGDFLFDLREKNDSHPKTRWFIAETDWGRKLKVVFIPKDNNIIIRTAYDPNSEELRIYNKYGAPEQ